MSGVLILYCVVALMIVAGLVAATFVRRLYLGRRARRDAELGRLYLRIVLHSFMSKEGEEPFFPRLYCSGARLVLAETLAHLVSTTYGLDQAPLRRVVEAAELESYLLRRARRTTGYRRAWFLSLLAHLPIEEQILVKVERFTHDRYRSVRFYALLVQLSAAPAQVLQRVADYGYSLSAFELSEIIGLLRRGALPVAYEPLVRASERNLRSLGLCIVRQFAIEQAEEVLLEMVATDHAPEFACEVLYTLCAMQRPLQGRQVARCVASMSAAQRKAILRYMAFEGYGEGVLSGLFSREEEPYFEALVRSYKRPLVCI